MSKPWGGTGIGSWAAEAELAEAEEREAAAAAPPSSFPSLKEAVTAKPKKKKMTLSEFNTYGSAQPQTGSTRLTPAEMLQLPTGPKLRSEDEYSGGSRLGGGFSSYGGGGGGPPGRRGGGFDDDSRRGTGPPPRRGGPEFDMPSRADEVDDWASMKRTSFNAPPQERERDRDRDRSSRYESLGGGSRADEVDNWNFGKKTAAPPPPGPTRSSTFGSGFRDSGGSDWRRGEMREEQQQPMSRPRLVLDPRSSSVNNNESTTNNNESSVVNKGNNPFGAARPREEVLAEKGLDWKKLDLEIEAKKASTGGGSRPTSSQGSRPTSSQSNRSESLGAGSGEVKPRPKVNPFGDAKPREVLLEQKGLDWKKMDLQLEHRRVDRPETEEEKALKEEIENLRNDLEKESGSEVSEGPGGEQTSLRDLIQSKERDLDSLIRELDDKVRFGQKAVERPGSGAGRYTSYPERPAERPGSGAGRYTSYPERPVERPGSGAGRYTSYPDRSLERPGSGAGRYTSYPERPGSGAGRYTSFPERPPQSGSFDDVRGAEAMDRPRSRGTGDVWTRPGEDRRGGFQGGRDRGFLGNRDFNRSSSRERW